jgi:hypothetical protein
MLRSCQLSLHKGGSNMNRATNTAATIRMVANASRQRAARSLIFRIEVGPQSVP